MLGLGLRLAVLGQTPIADELATVWVVDNHSPLTTLEVIHGNAEITPPLYFMLAELTTQIHLSVEFMRLPSLICGTLAIPLAYLLGLRTLGRRAGLVAAALMALSPFMIYYSTEARSYALMVALVLASTLSLLNALEGRGRGWWVAYALFSAACMYTHYTAAFALAAQAVWALWSHPAARKAVLGANAGAALAFAPWLTGLQKDFTSPTTDILDLISPFDPESIRISLEHWLFGYPYSLTPLSELPGTVGVVMLAAGVSIALVAVLTRDRALARVRALFANRRFVLVFALALSLPVGTGLVSFVSTNLFGTRNLAASLPAVAILVGALVTRAPRHAAIGATILVIASFGIGAVRSTESEYGRTNYDAVASSLTTEPPGTVIVDIFPATPGPTTPLDVELEGELRVLRIGVPQQTDHPFSGDDPIPSTRFIAEKAEEAARTGRIVMVTPLPEDGEYPLAAVQFLAAVRPRFEFVKRADYRGVIDLAVVTFERTAPARVTTSTRG